VSPVVHRGSVYVGGLDKVYALDARDRSPAVESKLRIGEQRQSSAAMIRYSPLLVRRCWRSTRAQPEGWTYTTGDDRFSTAAPRRWQRLRPSTTGAWERRRHQPGTVGTR